MLSNTVVCMAISAAITVKPKIKYHKWQMIHGESFAFHESCDNLKTFIKVTSIAKQHYETFPLLHNIYICTQSPAEHSLFTVTCRLTCPVRQHVDWDDHPDPVVDSHKLQLKGTFNYLSE